MHKTQKKRIQNKRVTPVGMVHIANPRGPIFSRHETFHPRHGWLKKGFDKALLDPKVFNREDAPVILGVGKNMVTSIRYWSSAFKVLVIGDQSDKKDIGSYPTEFGQNLLGKDGWDPFLENLASLWLLHWSLLKRPSLATAWDFLYSEFHQTEFILEDALVALRADTEKRFPDSKVAPGSLQKDINCIIRMYVSPHGDKAKNEDSIDSPFVDLEILRSSRDGKYYYFNFGKKPGLASEIIVAACLEYGKAMDPMARTISLSRLMYESASPGMIFKLTDSMLYEAIDQIAAKVPAINLSDTSGLVQLSYTKDPTILIGDLLDKMYGRNK